LSRIQTESMPALLAKVMAFDAKETEECGL